MHPILHYDIHVPHRVAELLREARHDHLIHMASPRPPSRFAPLRCAFGRALVVWGLRLQSQHVEVFHFEYRAAPESGVRE